MIPCFAGRFSPLFISATRLISATAIMPSKPPSKKRKAEQSIFPPRVKQKVQNTTSKNAVAGFFTPASQKPKSKTCWTERAPKPNVLETMLVGRYVPEQDKHDGADVMGKPTKIAAFDLDSTLIDTASGKKFGTDPADWKWWDPVVPKKLRQLHQDDYILAVFSNQGGLTLHLDPRRKGPKKATREDRVQIFKTKVSAMLTCLDLPIRIYAATGQDMFRKPRPGMWEALLEDCNVAPQDVDMKASVFVGDAGGRTAVVQTSDGKAKAVTVPKDFSCSDRNFAHNIGIAFQTPDEFFHGHESRNFERELDLGRYPFTGKDEQQIKFENSQGKKEIILFCGAPGAGKSSFYRRHLEDLGYVRVNQDTLKTKEKCLKVAAQHLEKGDSVVVDNTNPDPDTRGLWISLAQKHKVSVRCLWLKTPMALCEHNDAVRAMNSHLNPESRELLPKLAFSMFKSRYKDPRLEEGFDEIVPVEFKFSGTKEDYKTWSKYWI